MFYIGYLPSFWVRVRPMGSLEVTKLHSFKKVLASYFSVRMYQLPKFIPNLLHLPITHGAVFIFWAWICIAFSDVGAYFVGKNFGNTKLEKVSTAAGATSPNKTLEGVFGGCAVSGVLGMLGAWVMNWGKRWYLWGFGHGVVLAMLGLIGDLTASMLKRDAGIKDFGDFIPEHGGGERAKRASLFEDSSDEVREMATDIMATPTTKLTHLIRLACLLVSLVLQ